MLFTRALPVETENFDVGTVWCNTESSLLVEYNAWWSELTYDSAPCLWQPVKVGGISPVAVAGTIT